MGRRDSASNRRPSARIAIGRAGRRLTLSLHGITLSLGARGSGMHTIWRRSWRQIWADLFRTKTADLPYRTGGRARPLKRSRRFRR